MESKNEGQVIKLTCNKFGDPNCFIENDRKFSSINEVQQRFDSVLYQTNQPMALLCKPNVIKSKNAAFIQFEILQYSTNFFEKLPFDKQKQPHIAVDDSNNLRSSPNSRNSNLFFQPNRHSDKKCIENLTAKLFTPHLITNSTVLHFQKFHDDDLKVSLLDIISVFTQSQKDFSSYFFKCEAANQNSRKNSDSEIQNLKRKGLLKTEALETQYFAIEIKQIELTVKEQPKRMHLMTIHPITEILKKQQKKCDELYQEAIEANYSHEQMTPLNSILGNTHNPLDDFITFTNDFKSDRIPANDVGPSCFKLVSESCRFLQAIRQSG